MDCEPVREDIEAYALGALDVTAAKRLEVHLRSCSGCRDLARAYAVTVDHLTLAVPIVKAPPRLKERVLGGVGAFRPTVTPATLVRSSRWWAAAAAVFLAVGLGAAVWALSLSRQVDQLKKDNAALASLTQLDAQQRQILLQLQTELNAAKSQQRAMESTLADQATLISLALDPNLIPTDLAGTAIAPSAECRYVWSTQQSLGALHCVKLPSLSFNYQYQLWAVRGDRVVSMGVFLPRTDGTAHLLVKPAGEGGPITGMFVTMEPGNQVSRQPSAEVILDRVPSQQAQR